MFQFHKIPLRIFAGMLISCALHGAVAHAQTRSQAYGSSLDKMTFTAFVGADAGWSTYESKIAESNATGQTMRYSVGVNAGEKRTLGMTVRIADTNMDFSLNNNNVKTSWKDVSLNYRFWYFCPRAFASMSEMKVTRDGVTFVDLYGTGYGGSLGLHIPFIDRIIAHMDATLVKTPKAFDKNQKIVELGDRIEVDAGASIILIKEVLGVDIGYLYRTYKIKVEEETFVEKHSSPYVGLKVGIYF